MSRIPKELIDEIRNKSDIVETIANYINVDKKGNNYVALCPFHDDKNPSMSINQEKQIYKCFSCNAGGNVFTFIQDYEKISFPEAVIKQGKAVNLDMHSFEQTAPQPINQRKERLLMLLSEVQNFTSYQLKTSDGTAALDILHQRGYSDEVLDYFKVGVALSANAISDFLRAKGYTDEEMIAADVLRFGDNKLQDVFYNRIMFPIANQHGEVIAFSARTLNPNNQVKYINTGESELYVKSHHLYNLDKVKAKYRHADRIIIAEGVTDVFAFHMAGFDEVVATLGVNLSSEQIQLLKRHTSDVILAFDGDKAGYDATFNIGSKIIEAGLNLKVWYNDSGLDPDDLFRKEGSQALEKGLDASLEWYEFLLSYGRGLYGTESFDNKKRLVNFFLPYLQSVDLLSQTYYLGKLADATQFDVEVLKSQLKTAQESYQEPNYPEWVKPYPHTHDTTNYKEQQYSLTQNISRAELELLNQMLFSKEANFIYSKELGYLPSPIANEAALLIQNHYRTHNTLELADLISDSISEDMRRFFLEIVDRLVVKKYDELIVKENIALIKEKMSEFDSKNTMKKIRKTQDLSKKIELLDELLKKKNTRSKL